MRKLLSISVIVLVALAIMVVPALAITGNWVEDYRPSLRRPGRLLRRRW